MRQLSPKQKEFWNAPFHRWNIKYGATRTGKTYLDYFMIPRRIRERAGQEGLVVLMGNTKGTLQRNVIKPMQALYGDGLVSSIRSDNTATLFGEEVHCLGADKKIREDIVRGMSIKYCYGDEVVSWAQPVFEMVKSRLDKPYSCFDGTCNPKDPHHWFKKFLDSGADIFAQQYSLNDNPFLDPEVRKAMEREHTGVFYDRNILGLWVAAEGLVFPRFGENVLPHVLGDNGKALPVNLRAFSKVVIGVDFGGAGSQTCFCATGYQGYRRLHVLAEDALPLGRDIDADAICRAFVAFYRRVWALCGRVDWVLPDSASPTMINSLVSAMRAEGLNARCIKGCRKNPISERPRTVDRLLGQGRLTLDAGCPETIRALRELRWSEKRPDEPEDQNLGNINDRWDAFCYTWLDFVEFIDRWAVS